MLPDRSQSRLLAFSSNTCFMLLFALKVANTLIAVTLWLGFCVVEWNNGKYAFWKRCFWRTFFKRCKQQSDVDRTEIGVILRHYLLCNNWGRAKVAQHTATSQTMLPKITKVLINEKCITCKILALWYAGIVPSLTNSHLSVFCSHQNGLEQIPLSAWKKKKKYIYIYIQTPVCSHTVKLYVFKSELPYQATHELVLLPGWSYNYQQTSLKGPMTGSPRYHSGSKPTMAVGEASELVTCIRYEKCR